MANKEMTLSDIQDLSITMLKSVDDFCIKNDIQYSLGYGALIGAVRHKGFIPWDDDIDIIMTRYNYQKFIKLFNNDKTISEKGLKLYAPELGNAYFCISRICDMKRTQVRKYYQWTDDKTGIWIDVFPVDCLPEDGGNDIRTQSNRCFYVCEAYASFSKDFTLKRNVKIFVRRIKYWKKSRNIEIEKYLKKIDELPLYGSTEYVCNFGSPYKEKDIHKKDIFDNYIRLSFGNIEVSVIRQYDTYLRSLYGDYMELPPLNKRVRGHTNNIFYWK